MNLNKRVQSEDCINKHSPVGFCRVVSGVGIAERVVKVFNLAL